MRIVAILTLIFLSVVTMSADTPTVRVDARALQPGEVMSVTIVSASSGEIPRVTAFGRRAPVFPISPTTWRALVGIDLEVKPGPHEIAIETGPIAAPIRTLRQVTVLRKVFQTRRLTVAEAYVNPPAEVEARIEAEAARLATLFTTESGQRLWSGRFVRPVSDPANSAFGSRSVLNGQAR